MVADKRIEGNGDLGSRRSGLAWIFLVVCISVVELEQYS